MNKMKKSVFLALTLLALAVRLRAAEVTVFAAASLTDSLQAIATDYEKQSGDKILFNFGASSTLARQLEQGAPADIFFSADEAKMDGLQKDGLIDLVTRQDYLGNALVVVVPADSKLTIKSASDLAGAAVNRIALADPKAVPAGIYAKKWFENAKVWSSIESKVVPVENVRAALGAVVSGNVDAGVVYKTDAAITKHVKVAYKVPATDAPPITYPLALLRSAGQPAAARNFLHYLRSDAAAAVFTRFGFVVLKTSED